MGIWNAIASNPDALIGVLSLLGGIFGVKRWRKATAASTVAQIDEWTEAAIGGVALLIDTGMLQDHESAVAEFLRRLRALAEAAGIEVRPDHEARALAKAHAALVRLGQTRLGQEAQRLAKVANEALAAMQKLRARHPDALGAP